MKVRFYLAMAAAALLMTNCSQDEPLAQSKGGTNTLTATIEGGSRSSVTDGGVFSWSEGDALAVGNADGGFTKFEYVDGKFSASTSIVPTGYAIYPYNEAYTTCGESLPTITLPAEYAYGSTNAPMLATIGENATSLEFKHLAGLMRFKVKNVPVNATTFKLTADKGITGSFTPTTSDNATSIAANETATDDNKSVSITFEALSEAKDMTFYVPMPVGTYESLKVTIGEKELASTSGATNEITRGKLLLMPTMVFNSEGNLELEGGNNVTLNADEEISLDVNDGEEVVVEITEGATATLNLTAPVNSSEGLTISDGSEEGAESGESTATLNVSAENVSTLTINTPTLTVNLTSGSYEKVEALTAQQTLIIGDDVTIGELVLKGGNLKLEGDLTLSKPLVVNKNLVLDLNDHTLTTSEELTSGYSAAVIVYAGTVTIKNGTIATSGAAAHKNMGALWVRGTESATVTIEEGAILKGNNWNETVENQTDCLATVYVSNSNGYVTINGGEFYCVNQTQVEGQNQILNYTNSFTTKNIVVNGGKFHGMNPAKGNGEEVSYLGENALVAETASGVFEVLSATNGTIALSNDMTIVSPLTINSGTYTLDLGGKTLTTAETLSDGAFSSAVMVYGGTLTIKNGTIATSGAAAHKNMGALWVRGTESATVTIEEGAILKGNNWNETAENQTDCLATVYVSNSNGYVTINGGEFYCVNQTQVEGQNQILNYKNSFATKNIVINGGKFYGMNPAKGNGEEVSYLGENALVAETASGVFEVLSATNGTIALSNDMTIVSPLTINSGTYTLDLGGNTLTTSEELISGYSAAVIVYAGTVTIKNGTIATSGAAAHKNMGALWVRGTESAAVTIENGAILKGNNWNETAENQTDCLATVYVSNSNGKVTINGGEFYCVKQTQINGQNQILNYGDTFTTQAIEVKGGKFYRMDPAKGNGTEQSYLAEGYTSAENTEDDVKIYIVEETTEE